MILGFENHCKKPPWLLGYILALTLCVSLALTPKPSLAEVIASTTGVACGGATVGTSVYTTMQAAVSAAVATQDPVIRLCPGTYTGPVTIENAGGLQSLSIIGGAGIAGSAEATGGVSTFGSGCPPAADKTAVTISGDGSAGPIIEVLSGATDVTIANLTIDGLSTMTPTTPGGPVIGLQYGLRPGNVCNVLIQNIRNPDGSAHGIGFNFVGEVDPVISPAEKTVNLVDCMITNASGVAIKADGEGTNLQIEGCMVTGPVFPFPPPVDLLQISRGAKAKISDESETTFTF